MKTYAVFFMADWHDLVFENRVWSGALSRHLQRGTKVHECRSVGVYTGTQPLTSYVDGGFQTRDFFLTCEQGVHQTKGESGGSAEHLVEDGVITLQCLRL